MQNLLSETLAEILSVVIYGGIAGAITLFGLVFEQTSVQNFLAGEVVLALWFGYVGTLALYAGIYAVGYRKFLPTIRRVVGN